MRERVIELIRTLALGGLAAAIAGVVVFGIGGRVVMFVSRLLHPESPWPQVVSTPRATASISGERVKDI